MSAIPRKQLDPCPVCEADNFGCWRMRDGAIQCKGTLPLDARKWQLVTQFENAGKRVRVVQEKPPQRASTAEELKDWSPYWHKETSGTTTKTSDEKASGIPTPVVMFASEIEEKPVRWIWSNRFEAGTLNLLGGDPGSSKSLFTAALAATITTGWKWPDSGTSWFGSPRNVIFVSSEDDPAKATTPRLRAAGADLERVAILRTVIDDGNERQLCLQRDLLAIEQAVDAVSDVALIVIDPIDSYLGSIDSNANEQVRRVLEPLLQLAERRDIAVLAIKHLNKATNGPSAMYRIAGSAAFVALPRCVHLIGSDPDDKARKLFMPLKISHGPKPEAMAYRVRTTDSGMPLIEWEGTADVDPDDVAQRIKRGDTSVKERALQWLREALETGPQPTKDIEDRARAEGISLRAVDRARAELNVKAVRKDSGWYIALPDSGVSA